MGSPVILIVEDEGLISSLLGHVLRAGGYETLMARSGAEALSLGRLYQGDIDLLLCDVLLPDQAGFEVALNIWELYPRVKTLFTSGYPLDSLIERGLLPETLPNESEFFIPKPFRPKELIHFVDRILSMPRPAARAGMKQRGAASVSAAH